MNLFNKLLSTLRNIFSFSDPRYQQHFDWDPSKGGGGGSYVGGNGISIVGNTVTAKVDGSSIGFDTSGNLKTLGGSGVTKEYVDEQDAELQEQIDEKQDEITDTIASEGLTDTDYLSDLNDKTNKRFIATKIWDYIKGKITGAASTALEQNFITNRAIVTNASGKLIESQTSATELSYVKDVTGPIQNQLNDKADKSTTYTKTEVDTLVNNKADKSTTYTKTETDTKLDAKLNLSGGTMTGAIITKSSSSIKRDVDNDALGLYGGSAYNKGAYLQLAGKDRSSIAGGFTLCATNGTNNKYLQGKPDGSLNWDNKNILIAKSTNGTLTKSSVITNDYSHYIKNENIYQLSIGFQNTSEIANNTVMFTLPETISNTSIEMYIVISNTAGDSKILQCGGGGSGSTGSQIKSKQAIPAGYWFGSAIFIKV